MLKKDEQEIGIAINGADDVALITVTDYGIYLRKLERLSEKYPNEYKLIAEYKSLSTGVISRQYAVKKQYIRFGHGPSAAKIEAGRQAAKNLRGD